MKYFIIAAITAAMLIISISIEAESLENAGQATALPHRRINQADAKPVVNKDLKKVTDVQFIGQKKALAASPAPVYKKATIRPRPIAIKSDSIRRACLTGNLPMGEALQIFEEYFNDSEYKEHHEISGIRLTRDHETRETVYKVDLCPVVRYNDDDGYEIEASFFIDMNGEIFISERLIDRGAD